MSRVQFTLYQEICLIHRDFFVIKSCSLKGACLFWGLTYKFCPIQRRFAKVWWQRLKSTSKVFLIYTVFLWGHFLWYNADLSFSTSWTLTSDTNGLSGLSSAFLWDLHDLWVLCFKPINFPIYKQTFTLCFTKVYFVYYISWDSLTRPQIYVWRNHLHENLCVCVCGYDWKCNRIALPSITWNFVVYWMT